MTDLRVTKLDAEALTEGDAEARLTKLDAEVVSEDGGELRATKLDAEAVSEDGGEFRLSHLIAEVIHIHVEDPVPGVSGAVMWKRTGTKVSIGTDVDRLDLRFFPRPGQMLLGRPWPQAAREGVLDGATIVLERAAVLDWADALGPPEKETAADVGSTILFSGRVSHVDPSRHEIAVDVSSDMELLSVQMPRNVYQPGCMHTLYDSGCALLKATYEIAGAVTAGSTLNTIAASGLTQLSGYFDLGTIEFTSGALAGVRRSIKLWDNPTKLFHVPLPLPVAPAAGDTFFAYPGCDKKKATCDLKFGNLARFRGFPYVPVAETAR